MGYIIAKFQEKIFFSRKEGEVVKNDFCFSFYKISDSVNKQDFSNNVESVYPKVYIQGLEQLFDDDGSIGYEMENFANALNASNEDWSVSYVDTETYGKCIVITCSANKLDDTFTVNFQVPYRYEFSSKFDDKASIGITIHFDDFNTLCPDLSQNITQQYIITALELPYVDDFAVIDSQKKRVKTVPKGECVEITWKKKAENKTSVSLCNENGELITNVFAHKVQVNEDRKFTLNLEKDGQTISLPVPINQISPVEVVVYNQDGERWWHNGDSDTNKIARITWSGKNIEKCDVSLCDKNGVVVAKESPYIYRFDKYGSNLFTLKIERDDCVITKVIPVGYRGWVMDDEFKNKKNNIYDLYYNYFCNRAEKIFNLYKEKKDVVDLTKNLVNYFTKDYFSFLLNEKEYPLHDEKGSNLFFFTNCYPLKNKKVGFLFYIHPKIWFFDSVFLKNEMCNLWNVAKSYDNHPTWNDIKCYKTSSISRLNLLCVCYTFNDHISIREYDIRNAQWRVEYVIEKEKFDKYANKDKDGEFLFCQGGPGNISIYAVYQHAIYYFENIPSNGDIKEPRLKFTLPEEVNEANIVSISYNEDCCEKLAILCDNNYVYLRFEDNFFNPRNISIYLEHVKNSKDILLYDEFTVIVDGHVIEFDSKGKISHQEETMFSPKQTIENPENMFFGINNDKKNINALTWDQKGKNLWKYKR